MLWTRFPARHTIPQSTRWLLKSRMSVYCPRLLTIQPSPPTRKKIRERTSYLLCGPDPPWAGSTISGVSLTTAQAHCTAAKHHPRRVAIFGGSFDPVHNGHLSVARAADRRFNFDELHFIPASR